MARRMRGAGGKEEGSRNRSVEKRQQFPHYGKKGQPLLYKLYCRRANIAFGGVGLTECE